MYENPVQYFDEITMITDYGMVFTKYNPTGMNFYDIYNHLVIHLGKEDSENDYIPSDLITLRWQNDFSKLSLYIDYQEARIRRYWFYITKNENGELNCSLNWEYDNLLRDATISASFFYSTD